MTKWQSLLTEEDFTSKVLSAMVLVMPSPGEVMMVTWQLLELTVHSFSPLSSLRPVRAACADTGESHLAPGASVHCGGGLGQ